MKKLLYLFLLFFSIRVSSQCTYTVVASYTAPSCPTCCDGIIAASVQGAICIPATSTLQPLGISTPNWTYSNLCAGSYTVHVSDGCMCFGICGVTLPSGSTNILHNSFSNEDIRIYPNPVSTSLSISADQYFEAGSQIEIVNYLGQTVFKSKFKKDIDVSEFSNGVYFLRIKTLEQQVILKRFVVAR